MPKTLITPEYTDLNRQLHASRVDYGTSGHAYAEIVQDLAFKYKCKTLLDYGCGKATLAAALPEYSIANYDPAIPQFSERPSPADLVVCTDVLEHIEPMCLTTVLRDIFVLARKAVFLVIYLGPSYKTLADGRNAHLIQKPIKWWFQRISDIPGDWGYEFVFGKDGKLSVALVKGEKSA